VRQKKAAKRSESWDQTISAPLFISARKKPRLEEPPPSTTDEATTKNRSHHASTTVARPPSTDAAIDHSTATADSDLSVIDMHPNAELGCRCWTPEEDVKLTVLSTSSRGQKQIGIPSGCESDVSELCIKKQLKIL
jgi:hypothetical protein